MISNQVESMSQKAHRACLAMARGGARRGRPGKKFPRGGARRGRPGNEATEIVFIMTTFQ